jgi:hypothetical protein
MVKTFLEWKDEDCFLSFFNEDTCEAFETLSPKRGNPAYAKNKRKKAWEIYQGLKKLDLDYPVPHARDVVRDTHLLLVTLTFDQKAITKDGAWHLITSKGKAFNRFSANLSKIFGTKASWKVKEGTGSGYPAPHVLVMLDRPVRAFRYRKTWRIQSEKILDRLRKAWPYGFIDVMAIISSKVGKYGVVGYLTKYLTKSVTLSYKNSSSLASEQWEKEKTAILTHVWNKVFKCRDVLSKAFKQRLNSVHLARSDANSGKGIWALFSFDHRIDLISSIVPRLVGSKMNQISGFTDDVDSKRS